MSGPRSEVCVTSSRVSLYSRVTGRYIGSSLTFSHWVTDTLFSLASAAFGSVDESPTTISSSPSKFPLSTPTPNPRLNIHKRLRNPPSSPPITPLADQDPPLALSATLSTSTHPPSPKAFQDSASHNPKEAFPSDVPPTQPRSPLFSQQKNLAGGTSGGVGVGNRPPPIPRRPDSSLLMPTLQEALNVSITSGRFDDTKIYLFSRRDAAGDICKPRALYANSVVLKSVPYFNDRMSSPEC